MSLPRDVPPSDPLHPGDGYFAVGTLVRAHGDQGDGLRVRTMFCPIAAYRDLATANWEAQIEATHGGGFFTTVPVLDGYGHQVGGYRATTMGKKAPDDRSSTPKVLPHPELTPLEQPA